MGTADGYGFWFIKYCWVLDGLLLTTCYRMLEGFTLQLLRRFLWVVFCFLSGDLEEKDEIGSSTSIQV